MKIYTWASNPFRFGGPQQNYVGTEVAICDNKVVNLGRGFKGLLVRNPARKCWHIALRVCGAIVGTKATKGAVVRQVQDDIETGDPMLMGEQVEQARKWAEGARILLNDDFFGRFKDFPLRQR